MKFTWIGGGTWILQIDDLKIACDPVLCPKDTVHHYPSFTSTRLNDPVYDATTFNDIDLWLITHTHEDHLDSYGLNKIKSGRVYSNTRLKNCSLTNAKVLKWLEVAEYTSKNIKISIKAIPAYHAKNKFLGNLIGNGNGYILEIKSNNNDKKIVYITGDCVFNEKIIKLIPGTVDVVITNAGQAFVGTSPLAKLIGRITNNKNDIIKLYETLKPATLIPAHWGTFSHYTEDFVKEDFKNHPSIKVLEVGESIKL